LEASASWSALNTAGRTKALREAAEAQLKIIDSQR